MELRWLESEDSKSGLRPGSPSDRTVRRSLSISLPGAVPLSAMTAGSSSGLRLQPAPDTLIAPTQQAIGFRPSASVSSLTELGHRASGASPADTGLRPASATAPPGTASSAGDARRHAHVHVCAAAGDRAFRECFNRDDAVGSIGIYRDNADAIAGSAVSAQASVASAPSTASDSASAATAPASLSPAVSASSAQPSLAPTAQAASASMGRGGRAAGREEDPADSGVRRRAACAAHAGGRVSWLRVLLALAAPPAPRAHAVARRAGRWPAHGRTCQLGCADSARAPPPLAQGSRAQGHPTSGRFRLCPLLLLPPPTRRPPVRCPHRPARPRPRR